MGVHSILTPWGEELFHEDFAPLPKVCEVCGERFIDCCCPSSQRQQCEPDECPDCGRFMPDCKCAECEECGELVEHCTCDENLAHFSPDE